MAITDIKEFSHLTEADVEALGRELDQIRLDIEDSRGIRDAATFVASFASSGRWSSAGVSRCSAVGTDRHGWSARPC